MFYQSLCAGDGQRAHLVPPLSDEEFGYDYWAGSKKETKLHVQLLACTLLQPNIPQWDMLCWT